MEGIRSDLKVALDRPEKMRAFLTKNMNIWVDKKDNGYMDMSKWQKCEVDNLDFSGATLWIGCDLSMTTDLTSVGWVGMDDEGDFIVGQHSFMPEARLKEKMATDKVRYDLWAEQGYLTLTPGEMVDYTIVESWMKTFLKTKKFKSLIMINGMHCI